MAGKRVKISSKILNNYDKLTNITSKLETNMETK